MHIHKYAFLVPFGIRMHTRPARAAGGVCVQRRVCEAKVNHQICSLAVGIVASADRIT